MVCNSGQPEGASQIFGTQSKNVHDRDYFENVRCQGLVCPILHFKLQAPIKSIVYLQAPFPSSPDMTWLPPYTRVI